MEELVDLYNILSRRQEGQTIPAFNIHNLETLQGVMEAVEELDVPVIIQTTWGTVDSTGADYLVALARVAAERAKNGVCLHLDHAQNFEQVEHCLKAGYKSVMIDGSRLDYGQNVLLTKKCREITSYYGASLEAEIGRIIGREDLQEGSDSLTDPDQASAFVQDTGVDALAVAVGTAHGLYLRTPQLDFARLEQIHKMLAIPIVLHGGSGLSAEIIHRVIGCGVAKVNFATELRLAFVEAIKNSLVQGKEDPRDLMKSGRNAVRDVALEKIHMCMGV